MASVPHSLLSQEPSNEYLRIVLNYFNQKDLIASKKHRTVQVWKRGALLDEFSLKELMWMFQMSNHLFPMITSHLRGETTEYLHDSECLDHHTVYFVELRGKRFILVRRDDHFGETHCSGSLYLSLTSWSVIRKHASEIYTFVYGYDEVD